jgi:hypothetical protein
MSNLADVQVTTPIYHHPESSTLLEVTINRDDTIAKFRSMRV